MQNIQDAKDLQEIKIIMQKLGDGLKEPLTV